MEADIDMKDREYLGDGVYVAYSGYDYQISVNDHRNPPVVYMTDSEIDALVRFRERIKNRGRFNRKN